MKKTNRLTCGIVAVIIGCTATMIAPVRAQTDGDDRGDKPVKQSAIPKGLRVFYASHSLMWYVPKPLGEMAEAAGIKGHKLVGLQSLGASKTSQHWSLADDKNDAKKALETGKVDVFVMSPSSFPDETTGDMAEMCEWLCGSNKMRISSSDLLSALLTEDSVRRNAYKLWEESGQTQGHDVADWIAAEDKLYGDMWQSLGTVQT